MQRQSSTFSLTHPMYMDPNNQSIPATTVIPLDDSNQKLLQNQTQYGQEKENTDTLPNYYNHNADEKIAIAPKDEGYIMDHLENAQEPPREKVPFLKRHCCTRWCCCTCCLPPCVAFCCWFIFIAIIICIIVIGAILATFSVPKVDFLGVDSGDGGGGGGFPTVQHNSNGFTIPLKMNLNVQNPNPVDIELKNIDATGFYPAADGTQIQVGTGHLDQQFIPRNSNTTFTYPFNIEYNPGDPNANTMLINLIQKCGFTGQPATNIDIKYKVKFAAKVLFVTVNPTINDGTSIPCPIHKDQLKDILPDELKGIAGILGTIGDGISGILGHNGLDGLAGIFGKNGIGRLADIFN